MAMFASCSEPAQKAQEAPLVRLVTVGAASQTVHGVYPGRTEASQTSNVSFRVSGTLDQVLVKEGAHVRKGQVIARMDKRDYEVQFNAVKAEYESTKAECERIIGLYEDGSTTAQNYDKARYGLEQITMKYRHAQDQLSDCEVRAPFDGYVQTVFHKSHETVSAGMPVVSMFTSAGIEVIINIPASEYLRSDDFQSYTATFDVLPGVTFPLSLATISQRANANQLYEVRLLLDASPLSGKITPGMTALVNVAYKASETVPVVIPSGAVFSKDGGSWVYVYEPQSEGSGRLVMTRVDVSALRLDGSVIIGSGLHEGQQVAESGVHHLTDGQVVRPNPEPAPSNVGGLL